jgi:hypothetical protein
MMSKLSINTVWRRLLESSVAASMASLWPVAHAVTADWSKKSPFGDIP